MGCKDELATCKEKVPGLYAYVLKVHIAAVTTIVAVDSDNTRV